MLLDSLPPGDRYSADVQLELNVENRIYPLAKSGPGYAFLRDPATIPIGEANLVMFVDGRQYRWNVWLTCETTPIDGKVEFRIVSGPHRHHEAKRQRLLFDQSQSP